MAQLWLDHPMRTQVTPDQMAADHLTRIMYGAKNIRGPFFYPKSPYGMGAVSCPPTPPNYPYCGDILHLDPTCEANNAQMQLDYSNAQIACQGGLPQIGYPTSIPAAYPTSIPAAPPPPTTPTVETGPAPTSASYYQLPPQAAPIAPPAAQPGVTPMTTGTSSASQTVPASQQPPLFQPAASGITASTSSNWEIWALAGAAVLAVFMMGGKH